MACVPLLMWRREFMFLVAGCASGADTEDVPLFKTGVSLVKVDARVTQPDGSDIAGLAASDFVVLDEGAPQKVIEFASESEPVEVLLVLDVSPSMRKSLADMSARAGDTLDRLRSGDRVAVLLFAERTAWLQPFTADVKGIPMKIVHSVFQDTLGRATYLNEALLEAARALRYRKEKARRAVIVMTDDEVFRNKVTDAEVVRELHAANALLSAILIGSSEGRDAGRLGGEAPASVVPYVKATGGDVVTGEAPEKALAKVLNAAFTRYTLQYASPGGEPGSFRRIRVELADAAKRRFPGAVVQARSGYNVVS